MKKNFLYYLSPSVLTGILSIFVIVPVSTYYLDPADFGIVAIITFFSALVVPLSSTGVVWVLSGSYYKITKQERKELVFNLFFVGIVLRTFWLLLFALAGTFALPKLVRSYEPVFLNFFYILLAAEWFNAAWELVSYVIILQKKARLHAALDLVRFFSRLLVLLLCLSVFKFKAVSLMFAYFGMAVGGFIFSVLYIRKHIAVRLRRRWIKEVVTVGFPTIPLNLFEVISNSIARFFIEHWVGLSRLGIYSHSQDYKKMFILPQRAFAKSYSPEILQVFSGNSTVKIETMKSVLRRWFGILALSGTAVVLFSKDIIAILTHGKFTQAAPLVSLWFILIVIYAFGVPYTQFLLVNKKNKLIVVSQIILGILSWGVIALGVKFFGIVGATVATLLYFFAVHFVRKVYSLRLGCKSLEGNYFSITLILLVSLVFVVSIWPLSLLIKITIFILATPVIVKLYNLFPKSVFKQC